MAQYPQGVTDFIPDYQPFQPDYNFALNLLQLKQSQYDQNWNRLNSMYGQILNAPLTHDESIKKRDNTFKRIDFDLKRVTGLDLSLEQNVQQATQIFRPFYEDSSLMKDMAWTKNTSFERGLGEGKRYNKDKDINNEYWSGGIRAIDYKIEEFKATPYDQLPGFGDVKYTPYVNVEERAQKIAADLKIDVKRTTPQGDWIVTQKNGEQVLAPLQSVFYSMLGKDPKVQEMYQTRAYLERKDFVTANKDKPQYNGNAELAEKDYLNRTLKTMQNQSKLTASTLLSQKKANDKMINKLEQSIANGTDIETTSSALERYREANNQIGEMLKANEDNVKMLEGDVTRTLTTEGGSKLSMDDINEMRSRVDAVTAGNLLQADLDQAARNWVDLHGEVSYDPNPFAVQRQKYQYDSSLIAQRAAAQKDVAAFKHGLKMEELGYKTKLESGLYEQDPTTGELKMKPELAEVQALSDMMAKTGQTDPQKLTETINDLYKGDAESAKGAISKILVALQEEGTISNSELLEIMRDPKHGVKGSDGGLSSFNMKSIYRWLQENGKKPKGTPIDNEMKGMLAEEAMYTTSLEKEMMIPGTAGYEESQAKLSSFARNKLDDMSPAQITDVTKRMMKLLERKRDDPKIRNNSDVGELVSYAHKLDDFAEYKKAYIKSKEKLANEIADKLRARDFMYANAMFDDELNFVDEKGFIANIAKMYPDDIMMDNGMSWAGFWNTVAVGATGGATAGMAGGPFAGITVPAGTAGGALSGALAYTTTGVLNMAYDALFGDEGNSKELKYSNSDWFGNQYTIREEFEAMKEEYENMVADSRLNSEVLALNHPIGKKDIGSWNRFTNWLGVTEQGTGLYTANGAGITVESGLLSPTYNHWLELQKVIRNLDLQADDGKSYVTFNGVNSKFDDLDDPTANREAFAAIWADFSAKTGLKKDKGGIGRFIAGVSPFGGEDVGKAAVQLRLPEDYLKKFKPDSDGKGIMTMDAYNEMLKNGITIITDAKNLSNVTIFKNSYKTPEQIRIEKAGGDGVTYDDPRYPGYSINYKINPLEPSQITVTSTFQEYDPNSKKMVQLQDVDNMANMGNNLVSHRQRFFNEFAVSQQYRVNQLRRQYERR